VNSISPPVLPAISSEDGRVVVDGAARTADERQGEDVVQPRTEAEASVNVEDEGDDNVEGVKRRALPSPYMPSISEIREHKTTHVPYRSWCDECVEAFAREWPHLHQKSNGRSIPVIHMDYACLTEKGLFKVEDLDDE